MRNPLFATAMFCFCSTALASSQPLGFVAVAGDLTFTREKENTNFFIQSSLTKVVVRLKTERAFGDLESVSFRWAQALSAKPAPTMQIGPGEGGIGYDATMARCLTTPGVREAGRSAHRLRCVAGDDPGAGFTISPESDILYPEIEVAIETEIGSELDTFLLRHFSPSVRYVALWLYTLP